MRVLIAVTILYSLPSPAEACKSIDITQVRGARTVVGTYDEPPKPIVPSHPSLFVHLGGDGPRGMPRFSTLDGRPIPLAKVTTLRDGYENLHRVDLDIDQGVIVVRLPGNDTPVATYSIDPSFTPRTRSVELLPSGMTLWIDSDAVAFQVEGNTLSPEQLYSGRVPVVTGRRQRVVALYPNGTNEVIYDDVPIDSTAPAVAPCVVHAATSKSSSPEPLLLGVLAIFLLAALALHPDSITERASDGSHT